jgi:SAM-dependent methyltransferase
MSNMMENITQCKKCPICGDAAFFAFHSDFFEVFQCENSDCQHLFAVNVSLSSGEGTYSDKLYKNYLHAARDDKLVRFLHGMNFFNPFSRILDFGAGPGFFSDAVRRILIDPDITCVEASDSMRRHLESKGFRVFSQLEEVPSSEKYNSVIIKEVIEHVFDPVSILKGIKKIIAPNGKVLVTTPAGDHRSTCQQRNKFGAYQEKTHIHFFTESSLIYASRLAGFERVGYCYIDSFYPGLSQELYEIDRRTRQAYEKYSRGTYQHLTFFIS